MPINLTMTHIGTATAILDIDGVKLLTDPVFDDVGAEYDLGIVLLKSTTGPAIGIKDLPPIDAVLLSHEDHPDNLDDTGRQLLDGRVVITTVDGAKKLQPRPGVTAIRPWETLSLNLGGKPFKVTGTPCDHLPGGEVTGFILESDTFGETDGKPNVIYFSGDTLYMPELVQMKDKYHVSVAILNLGIAQAPLPNGPLDITMGGKDAVKLAREIKADVVVPMHFDNWKHFSESSEQSRKIFEEEGFANKVCWLTPGVAKKII
ncbi:beta-lactamase superfamily domain-containing protein [Fennellomyces sp. T-0311]|nr:beta-lactamase superfamily domain-containing protein [Fennellomyces sp. T-0311]